MRKTTLPEVQATVDQYMREHGAPSNIQTVMSLDTAVLSRGVYYIGREILVHGPARGFLAQDVYWLLTRDSDGNLAVKHSTCDEMVDDDEDEHQQD